jgi:hypothetical protein
MMSESKVRLPLNDEGSRGDGGGAARSLLLLEGGGPLTVDR